MMAALPHPEYEEDYLEVIPVQPWEEFRKEFQDGWRQGEHVTLIGPTGSGKTTLALNALIPPKGGFPWTTVFVTKRKDEVLDELKRRPYNFQRIEDWTVADPEIVPRVIFAPQLKRGVKSIPEQREAFQNALEAIFRQGGWTLYLDEALYITQYLGLGDDIQLLWHQGRSAAITVIAATQRPRHIPLMAYDQATHLFFWHNADRKALDRLSEIGGRLDPDALRRAIKLLSFHQVLYVNPHSGKAVITEVKL